jgi:tetrapyrrole methylase family protein / MazG family protein
MGKEVDRFIAIVKRLRDPGGCPWDREQTHASLLSCLLDESYEFFEAVDESNSDKMREELGDLLLQVVLHAQIAQETSAFDIEAVAAAISEKIVRRHPHVFGDVKAGTSKEVLSNWEKIKKGEKGKEHRRYLVDDIPAGLPALFRAEKMQRRVARVGFDWKSIDPVLDKVEEEFGEFREALAGGNQAAAEEELGDILFALVNVARHQGVCAEEALRKTINKFAKRFRYIEDQYKQREKKLEDSTLDEMDVLWEESKKIVG